MYTSLDTDSKRIGDSTPPSSVAETQTVRNSNNQDTLGSLGEQAQPSCFGGLIDAIAQFFLWLFCCRTTREEKVENTPNGRREALKKTILDKVQQVMAIQRKQHLYLVLRQTGNSRRAISFNCAMETFDSFKEKLNAELYFHREITSPVQEFKSAGLFSIYPLCSHPRSKTVGCSYWTSTDTDQELEPTNINDPDDVASLRCCVDMTPEQFKKDLEALFQNSSE